LRGANEQAPTAQALARRSNPGRGVVVSIRARIARALVLSRLEKDQAMSGKPWSVREVQRSIAIVRRHTTITGALREISEKVRKVAGKSNFNEMLSTHGYQPAREYLKPIETAPVDPVARRTVQDAHARTKRERDELIDRLRDAEARTAYLDAISVAPTAVTIKPFPAGNKRAATAVAMASDWHIEETVEASTVQGRNEYNIKIAKVRAERFFQGVQWLIRFHRQAFDIRALVLALMGDLITGFIHEELQESNGCAPTEAVLLLLAWIEAGIRMLLKDGSLDRIVVPCCYGNHGRTTQKRRIATGAVNSFEWLMYQILKDRFRDEPRVEFDCGKSAHQYVRVHDRTLHFHHGDEVRFLGGVGGLAVPLGRRIPKWDNVIQSDYHHVGHFHQFLDLGHTLVNGSLMGYNAYAMSIGADFEEPRQAFYLLDAKRGKTCVSPIWVKE
jgi:hypothetical protein